MGVFDSTSKKIHNLLGMTALGQKTKATALGVTLASDEDAIAATIAAGADVTEGNTSDAAVITDTTGTLSGKLRGLIKWAFERMPAALGQTTMSASLPVVVANNQTAVPSSVASGNNVTEGAVADAAVDTDTTGTLSGKLRGLVKLMVNYLTRFPAALGQGTMAQSLPVVLASNQSSVPVNLADSTLPLNVGFYLSVNKFDYATVNASNTAYTESDLIGTKLTIAAGTPASGGSGTLKSIIVVDKGNIGPELLIELFDADPTGTTFTDADTLGVVAADQPKIAGYVRIDPTDWAETFPKMAFKKVEIPMRAVGSRNLFAAVLSAGNYSPGIDEALAVTFGFHYDNS